MIIKLVRTDAVDPCKIKLPLGEHLFGRGKLLDCNDARISRQHGTLIVSDDSLTITAMHQNPCFVRKCGKNNTEILKQDSSVTLRNGDRFGLLPDLFWYEVLYCSDNETPNIATTEANTEEYCISNNVCEPTTSGETSSNQTNADDVQHSDSLMKEINELETLIGTKSDQNVESESISDSNMAIDQPNEQNIQNEPNAQKDPDVLSNNEEQDNKNRSLKRTQSSDNIEMKKPKVEPIQVKNEDSAEVKPGPSLNQVPSNDNAASSNNAPNNQPRRERCMYGANCYSGRGRRVPGGIRNLPERHQELRRRCWFCGCNTNPTSNPSVRSYALTERFLTASPDVVMYAQQLYVESLISKHDRICRQCCKRANEFYKKKQAERSGKLSVGAVGYDSSSSEDSMDESTNRKGLSTPRLDGAPDVPLISILKKTKQEPQDPSQTPKRVQKRVSFKEPEAQSIPHTKSHGQQTSIFISYKQMPYSTKRCFIKNCTNNTGLHKVKKFIRVHILKRLLVYVPSGTRVCQAHLHSNVWRNLLANSPRLHRTFTNKQVTKMVAMWKVHLGLNFEQLESIHDCIFSYCVGLTKPEFLKILEQTEALNAMCKAKTRLAVFCAKMHTKDSSGRLSKIFQMSTMEFRRSFRKVQSCLPQDVRSRIGE